MQVSGALAEGTDAETAALNVEMGSLAVPNSAQHAAETALASLEARLFTKVCQSQMTQCRVVQFPGIGLRHQQRLPKVFVLSRPDGSVYWC